MLHLFVLCDTITELNCSLLAISVLNKAFSLQNTINPASNDRPSIAHLHLTFPMDLIILPLPLVDVALRVSVFPLPRSRSIEPATVVDAAISPLATALALANTMNHTLLDIVIAGYNVALVVASVILIWFNDSALSFVHHLIIFPFKSIL